MRPSTISSASALPSDVTVIPVSRAYYLADLNITAIAYGDHWEYSQIPARTWANILAIASTSLKAGMTCRASDLSLHTFIWDGSYWQSLNEANILLSTSRTAVTGSATGITFATVTIPAGLMGAKGAMRVMVETSYTADTTAKHLYLAYNGTYPLAGARSTTAVTGVKADLRSTLNGSGSLNALLNSASNLSDPFYSSTAATVYFDQTTSKSVTIQLAQAAAVSATMLSYDFFIERRAA